MTKSISVNEVIKKYVFVRDQKELLDKEYKDKIKEFKLVLGKLEAWIKAKADKDGVESFKSISGTAYITTVSHVSVGNWDAILGFIREHNAYDMLQKRLSKTAVCSHIEEHGDTPPGVDYSSEMKVNIRRPAGGV